MNMDYIRQRILMILDERKMTQKELATRAKISYVPLNRFLNNNRSSIGLDTLLCIANGLNIPVEFLLNQWKLESSMLVDTVFYKIDKLPENTKREFLLSMSSILDLLIVSEQKHATANESEKSTTKKPRRKKSD